MNKIDDLLTAYTEAVQNAALYADEDAPQAATTWAAVASDHRQRIVARIHARINRHVVEPGKKWGDPYQSDALRDSEALQAIRRNRTRIYQFATRAVRARFSHLLAREDD